MEPADRRALCHVARVASDALVAARAERLGALAGEDDGADGEIFPRQLEGLRELDDRLRPERVAYLGAVDRQLRYTHRLGALEHDRRLVADVLPRSARLPGHCHGRRPYPLAVGRLVVVRAEAGPSFVDALLEAWEHGDAVLPLDPRLPPRAASRLTESLGADQPVDKGDAVVVPTSGTTGDPKGVVLTHDALRASATVTSARLEADPERDIWLSCLPLAHIGGLSVVVRSLLTGTSLTFDPDAPATLVSLVPTQLRRMDVSRFRAVLLGGAAPPDDPPPNCIVTYGMTETGAGVVYDGRPL